jgi:hypothetical protein
MCGTCDERHWEDHPEIIVGRRTDVTRRLARQLVQDMDVMSIWEMARRDGLPWHDDHLWVVGGGRTAEYARGKAALRVGAPHIVQSRTDL